MVELTQTVNLQREEPIILSSFRPSWFSFVYVIPKQRKTKQTVNGKH